jgi:hypothetical protein
MSNLKALETSVEGLLAKERRPTPEKIRELISNFRQLPMLEVSDAEAEKLAREFEERHAVTMTIGAYLTERDYEPWLEAASSGIKPYYWERYKKLLVEKRFSGQVITTLDDVTDRTLGLLENPKKEGPWDRRGMVVGHVQSGKTANYAGLICKAADAGYKLIVVIAGIHNNLRNQTQLRIDEGFVGQDSAELLTKKGEKFVGVGRFDQTRRPVTFTNSVRDFNKQTATAVGVSLQDLREPAVFVIKKNATTLKNLIDWLVAHSAGRDGGAIDAPMLLIDDEADNASINIKYKHKKGEPSEVSRINGQIRGLLSLFRRSCYVGYTATPFANIFIDPKDTHEMLGDDLFPRHFIVSLDPPTNYFGPRRVFLDPDPPVVRHISDNEDRLPLKHKIDQQIDGLPDSLVKAVRTFVVARAIRLVRGQSGEHASMLVNASRFTGVQQKLRIAIHDRLESIRASLRVNGALHWSEAGRDPEISALREAWDREYSDAGETWEQVFGKLHEAAAPMKVVAVNSQSSGALNYADHAKTGLSVIAVGGFSLSRGLTLEGLMVSYFLRNSMMYDTLMQMGRWFGYRPGYDDLCRVWMPEEAEGWYAHIAESIEMLREELRRMQAANATPQEFGLKVRSHPDTLIVTARNKLGSGEKIVVSVGLANQFVETHTLKRSKVAIEHNLKAGRQLVENMRRAGIPLDSPEDVPFGLLFRSVPSSVVRQFLGEFDGHPGAMLADSEPIRRYIEAREAGELAEWDVLFASLKQPSSGAAPDESLGLPIHCQTRTAGERSNSSTIRVTNKSRVSSRGIERTGLSLEQVKAAETKYLADEKLEGRAGVNFPDRIYRDVRTHPLLVVHLLDIQPENGGDRPESPVLAWSLSFPRTEVEEVRVQFVVNTTWMEETYGGDADDDEYEQDAD